MQSFQFGNEFYALDLRIGIGRHHNGVQHSLDIAVFRFDFELAAGNLGQIQGFIDEIQHKFAGRTDFFQIFCALIIAIALHGQFRKAQNAVKRRAHIMTYIGHKGGLGACFPLHREHPFIALFLRHIIDEMRTGKAAIPADTLLFDVQIAVIFAVVAHKFLLAVHLQMF